MIKSDVLLLCVGPFLGHFLLRFFNLRCPLMPIKGYSFDIKLHEKEEMKYHFSFSDSGYVATFLEQ